MVAISHLICWRRLWKEAVTDFPGFPSVDKEFKSITKMGHNIGGEGFEDMEKTKVVELIEYHAEEELIKANEDIVDDETKVVKTLNFDMKTLAEIFGSSSLSFVEDEDEKGN